MFFSNSEVRELIIELLITFPKTIFYRVIESIPTCFKLEIKMKFYTGNLSFLYLELCGLVIRLSYERVV